MALKKISVNQIPEEVRAVSGVLLRAGYKAYLVGGCVRDLLTANPPAGGPKDWDITTDAKPEEIQKLFPESVYENQFGTVGVKSGSEDPKLKLIEVTTFRLEGKYTDKRHPDEITFAKTIEEDLSRRDFTVNAFAFDLSKKTAELIDPYGGEEDLKAKTIRTVGSAEARFNEDALRVMRAVRFACQLDFGIERATRDAIKKCAGLLEVIAQERIRDEFIKIIMTDRAVAGLILLEELDLLRSVLPELREGLGVGQNKHHIFTVFEHNAKALGYAVGKNYSLVVRLASLLHDVGKPRAKVGDGPDSTFYNHDLIGAKMTAKALDRLKFPREFIENVAHLVRYHLFYYNVGEVTESGVRRFIRRVGHEYIDDLFKVREADRISSGVPKAVPYKMRHLMFMIEKVKHDPLSPRMLKIDGEDVMRILSIPPSPKVGQILTILLEEVLDDPAKNTKENLEVRIKNLEKQSEKELLVLSAKARDKKDEFEGGAEEEMKKKYYVQ